MKVLVLGADGMLGHQVVSMLLGSRHEVFAATRRTPNLRVESALAGAHVLSDVDVRVRDTVVEALVAARPDAVINGIGIVKQRPAAKEALETIRVNALFPHELSALCGAVDARLIHISTDCVFSGRAGQYSEDDIPDPIDLYGRSKLLGEVYGAGCLTLRTSIIGLELLRSTSLVEWFLRQEGTVTGWRCALYSGLTTAEFARLIVYVLEHCSDLNGLWHVSSDPISKYDLLGLLRDALERDLELRPDELVHIDRTLNSERFRSETGFSPPPWREMIAELAASVIAREGNESV